MFPRVAERRSHAVIALLEEDGEHVDGDGHLCSRHAVGIETRRKQTQLAHNLSREGSPVKPSNSISRGA